MNIIRLDENNRDDVFKLMMEIEESLPQKEYWLPVTEVEKKNFFNDDWSIFYGIYDGDELVAASGIFYSEEEFGETVEKLNMDTRGVAEIGRCMVKPSYRGNRLLVKVNNFIIEKAKEEGLQYLVSTVYPDNLPSQKSFVASGFKKEITYVRNNTYVRGIFLLNI